MSGTNAPIAFATLAVRLAIQSECRKSHITSGFSVSKYLFTAYWVVLLFTRTASQRLLRFSFDPIRIGNHQSPVGINAHVAASENASRASRDRWMRSISKRPRLSKIHWTLTLSRRDKRKWHTYAHIHTEAEQPMAKEMRKILRVHSRRMTPISGDFGGGGPRSALANGSGQSSFCAVKRS